MSKIASLKIMVPLTLRITIENLRKAVLNSIYEDIFLFFSSEEYLDLDFVVVHRTISEKIPPNYMKKRGICERKFYFVSSILSDRDITTNQYAQRIGSHTGIIPKRLLRKNISTPVEIKKYSEINIAKNPTANTTYSCLWYCIKKLKIIITQYIPASIQSS
jgi:hypothetical protein